MEYHPELPPDYLVLDLDPPPDTPFSLVVEAAHIVRQAAADAGLEGAVKTSGSKGLHIFFPIAPGYTPEDLAAGTRGLAARAAALGPDLCTTAFIKEDRQGKVFVDFTRTGDATLVAAYSPRIRPGVPVSFPVSWDELASVTPTDFTIVNAVAQLAGTDPWAEHQPAPQPLPDGLVAEGHALPHARAEAMHEGKRRKQQRAKADGDQKKS